VRSEQDIAEILGDRRTERFGAAFLAALADDA
jgi:hypothetical protein